MIRIQNRQFSDAYNQHLQERVRSAFTIVELLVSIGIVGVLLAILLPAVQYAREGARHSQCMANMKQIAAGIHNFETRRGTLPWINTGRPGWWIDPMRTELELPTSGLGDSDKNEYPLVRCPTDPEATGQPGLHEHASYLISRGRGWNYNDGVAGTKSEPIRFRDVTDGLSGTAFFAERLARPREGGVDFEDQTHVWNRLILTTPQFLRTIESVADQCRYHTGIPMQSGLLHDDYNHIMTPNQSSCLDGVDMNEWMAITASSMHPGGANVSFGDGAVRFISESIDQEVWWALGSRNGNESIDPGW